MRLVIREYLTMLKESGELDALLPDLLLAMQIVPHSKPQKGTRQYGVDIAAVGKDPDDGNTLKLFLFTVKRGDIGRGDWDGHPQAVRPSLDEIIDVYLPQCVAARYARLPKKVVLCCGGELKQGVVQNWKGYTDRVSKSAGVEFDFWGADKLADLLDRHLLNEFLFPDNVRKRMRKTLALVGDVDYDLSDYYGLVQDLLFGAQGDRAGHGQSRGRRLQQLRLLHLCLRIVLHWAKDNGNIKAAYLAGERTVLRVWDWVRHQELYADRRVARQLLKIHLEFAAIGTAYLVKLQPYCYVRDGLSGYSDGYDEIEYPLRTFELIGILGVLGMDKLLLHELAGDNMTLQGAEVMADMLEQLIRLNPPALSPRYDGHAIDICLGLLLLYHTGRQLTAGWWVQNLLSRIAFAWRLGRYFPVASDSYDDLVALQVGQGQPKELMGASTLLPMLARWAAILGRADIYSEARQHVKTVFTETDLQLWYPDETTDEWLYRGYAARESGGTEHSIDLPETIEAARDRLRSIEAQVAPPDTISCIAHGLPVIALIASRHFRTPVMPFFWQRLVGSVNAAAETGS